MDDFNRMDRFMSSFGMPGISMMPPSIEESSRIHHSSRSHRHPHRQREQQSHTMMPFGGGLFGRSMFSEMDSMMV